MTNRLFPAIMATSLFTSVALATTAAQTPPDATSSLPAGPGRDSVVRVCSGCHALGVVTREQHDEAGWREIVDTMASRGAMASNSELAEIQSYLASHFAPTAANR